MCRTEVMSYGDGCQSLEVAKNTEPSGTGRGESGVAAMWPAREKDLS